MAEDKKSILVYADWINIFEELEDVEAGKLIKHFFRYVNDKNPEAPDRLTKLLFAPIKQTLKRDLVKYEEKREKNRQSALMRWNKINANASEGIKSDANHADSVSDSVSDSDINNKKKADFDFHFIDVKFIPVFMEWMDYKKSRNEKYKNQKSVEACYRNLLRLSSGNPDTARQIIDQATGNNWAGLFPLKRDNTTQQAVSIPEFKSGPGR
jgi:hypothetical protein